MNGAEGAGEFYMKGSVSRDSAYLLAFSLTFLAARKAVTVITLRG